MIEKAYEFSKSEKAVEKILLDENRHSEQLELIVVKAPAPKN